MRSWLNVPIILILTTCFVLVCPAAESSDPNRYLNAVREFADNVLKYGRDTYGPKHTPLFVDGLMVRNPNDPNYGKNGVFKPVEWIAPNGERWVLSNLASQQNLFRTLDGLTTISSDPKYKQAAIDATKYAFENLRSPNGLLYWGATAVYDAGVDKVRTHHDHHGLRAFYPYYGLMWQVDAEATSRFIEGFWSAHIFNWSNLDMNRYGFFNQKYVTPWQHEYKGESVFFTSSNNSFLVTGSDLFYAAAILSKLSGQEYPLVWGKRLAHRYIETRHPETGISLPQYNKMDPPHQLVDDFKDHLKNPRTRFFPISPALGDPNYFICNMGFVSSSPGTVASWMMSPWICELLTGDMLGGEGEEFIQWALDELTAWGMVSYRKRDNSWIPILTDGTSLEGYVCKIDGIYGQKGAVYKPIPAVPMEFWGYVLAYRITDDGFMWEMARSIALGNKFGDIGEAFRVEPKLNIETSCSDPYALLGFLELHRKTGKNVFLEMAKTIGDNILGSRFHKGFFVASKKHIYTKFDAVDSLALLHLTKTVESMLQSVPEVWPSQPCFIGSYRGKEHFIDNTIYTLTDSLEMPKSLQEVAAEGDIEQLRSLISASTDVDSREDGFFKTALHRAAISGSKDVIELLLAKGADVAAGDLAGNTPLHFAAQRGRTEIAELLINKGADLNAKNNDGQRPLDIALARGRKETVKLLRNHTERRGEDIP